MKFFFYFFVYVFYKYIITPQKNLISSSSIPVYWINLDRAIDRRIKMEHHLRDYRNTRVRAYNTSSARFKISKIPHDGVHFYTATKDTITYKKRLAREYSYKELACTLSHVKAIQQAYDDGHEIALISEDDVEFLPQFWTLFPYFMKTAPLDWDVLQLYTTHMRALKHVCKLDDPWIHWKPYFWGAQGYIMNRKGMRKILTQFSLNNRVIVADEFIYHNVNTYTTTYPQIVITGSPSSIQTTMARSNKKYASTLKTYLQTECKFPSLEPIQTKQSLAIITSVHSQKDIQNLKQDRQYLEQLHTGPIHWYLTDKSLTVDGMQHIDGIPKTDWVLFKHVGIRLIGIPWKTFFKMASQATVTGALRAHRHHHLIRTRSHSDSVFEVYMWQSGSGKIENTTGHGSFTQDIPIMVDMVEKSFALLNGTFARHFFQQKRVERYDYEWCGEASLFDSSQPCQIIPIVVEQEHNQLNLSTVETKSRAANYSQPFREKFLKSFSKQYRKLHLNDVPACLSHWTC